jgi:hypothetical protein
MELLPDDLNGMKDLWSDPASRQKAKLVLAEGITQATSITVKELRDIFASLDLLLVEKEEARRPRGDPAL